MNRTGGGSTANMQPPGLTDKHYDQWFAETIGPLKSIEKLSLAGFRITDASVPVIQRFCNLELLNITYTKISDDGATELRKSLPDCEIIHKARRDTLPHNKVMNASRI